MAEVFLSESSNPTFLFSVAVAYNSLGLDDDRGRVERRVLAQHSLQLVGAEQRVLFLLKDVVDTVTIVASELQSLQAHAQTFERDQCFPKGAASIFGA